ncbi:GNAT family N-acetyltransferase [Nocardioides sp.]|uniref:GNAT family N-acetyltransferase n=1 Tax=Nocardioides sp. TaxID=35761 RepID=UPI002ED8FD03
MPAPTLTDGVVTLRAHRPDDAQGTFEQCQDPSSQRWTTVPVPYSMADARSFVEEFCPSRWVSDAEWIFAVEHDGRYAGTVSLRNEGDGRAEIAYGSHPAVRGSGVVERALRLLLAWGFEERGIQTVIWYAHVGNWASRKVAWRLGFSYDGLLRRWNPQRGQLLDSWVGTLLRDDPREPRTTWLDNPVLEGDGIRLRPFTDADVPRIVEGIGHADTQFWLSFFPRGFDEEDGRRYVEQVTERLATNHTVTWAWCAEEDDLLLGVVGLHRLSGGEPEIGYWTHPDARGRRLTVKAARLAIGYGFDVLELPRLSGYAAAGNRASWRVLERLGMQRIGVQRGATHTGDGAPADLVGYDLLRAEWAEARSRDADHSSTATPTTESAPPTSAGER